MISSFVGTCISSSHSSGKAYSGCGMKVLHTIDWLIPMALIVIGSLACAGILPCPSALGGVILGSGILPLVYNILLTLAMCKRRETPSSEYID